uniref:RING-type domain-containing protein n=1 Tax=Strongyloides venezuelensis TaxID=75913 RepID=A0A0K0FEX9_STRVS
MISDNTATTYELSVNIKCGHGMEINTMKEWITKYKQCPYCLIPSLDKDIIKIYYEDTINEKYYEYYKEKYEEMTSERKVENNFFADKENIMDKFDYEIEYKKNRRLKNLLNKEIGNGTDYISLNAMEILIQMEINTKNEEINILKLKLFEEQTNTILKDKNQTIKNKVLKLECNFKHYQNENHKYFSRLNQLQKEYNRLEEENNFLKIQTTTMESLKELNDKINNQTAVIDNLTNKNESLIKEIKSHEKKTDKINIKNEQKLNELDNRCRELEKITEILERNSESFDDKEKIFYEFDKKICNLFPIFNYKNKTIQSSRNTFLMEQQKLGSLAWKKVGDDIYSRIKNFIDTHPYLHINKVNKSNF